MALDRAKLLAYLSGPLGVDTSTVQDATPLFSSALLDSFLMVELVVFLEKEGGFRMKPFDVNLNNLDSVERILAFVAKQGG